MDFFDLREPVNAWSHFSWLLVSVPGTWLLWRLARGDRIKQISLLVYGLTLAFCFASSALYHGARLSDSWIEGFDRLDHIAIYVLIAGSYTPIACNLLNGRARWIVLSSAWGFAAVCGTRIAVYGLLPPALSTLLYMVMGWGALFCYVQIARFLTHRALSPLLLGGVLYTVGAVINVVHRPVLWPGVFEAHELFHVFVMAGSLAHFLFMLEVVVAFARGTEPARVVRPAPHFTMLPGRLLGWRLGSLWVTSPREPRPPQSPRVPPMRWR